VNKSLAKKIVGSALSNTTKMPSFSFNLSALDCKTGAKLVSVENSVCNGCYALKGNYKRYKLTDKLRPKTEKINNSLWVESMAYLINNQGSKKDSNYFRWHDSGDLQSIDHLQKIVEVCKKTPNVLHWLPTREYKIVNSYIVNFGKLPKNLIVRLSSHMIDQKPPKIQGLNTSTVHKNKKAFGIECQSYKNNNECGTCRDCWNSSIKNISYKYH
jgi:hypothetical protein|tara:strand:+ start:4754 stop:5395 length:642 start_codon:yes stop_codon:yes gene_type:complete